MHEFKMTKSLPSIAESRAELRKVLRCAATIMSRNMPPVAGRTIDISPNGISVMLPKHMNAGDHYVISFDTTLGGNLVSVNAAVTLIYSVCVGTSGFRTGFQFSTIDAKTAQVIRQLSQL